MSNAVCIRSLTISRCMGVNLSCQSPLPLLLALPVPPPLPTLLPSLPLPLGGGATIGATAVPTDGDVDLLAVDELVPEAAAALILGAKGDDGALGAAAAATVGLLKILSAASHPAGG